MFFFFNDTATTEIYTSVNTLSLHDALPISSPPATSDAPDMTMRLSLVMSGARSEEHTSELQSLTDISYAVFCLKKKQTPVTTTGSSRSASGRGSLAVKDTS